ncbi:universal stress protein [Actinospica robiniae]|uniref:universal stress protein n=1 Tax=Actinospica robiniae TaxID=304901 RepID=UPI0004159D0D|nr:universal stress protein [Actinospica robiniae]
MTAQVEQQEPAEIARAVVGVDGSEPAQHAALWAADEAVARGATLTVLHAAGVGESIAPALGPVPDTAAGTTEGDRLLETTIALVRERHPILPLDPQISPLAPLERLTQLSGPDTLIVVGTRGHGAVVGMLLGSISRALVKHTRGPLVVVRGPDAAQHRSGQVVLGIATEPGLNAAQYAFDAAQRYRVGVQAVRTRPPLPPPSAAIPGAIDLPVVMPAGGGIHTGIPTETGQALDESAEAAEHDKDLVAVAISAAHATCPQVPVQVTCLEGDAASTLNTAGEDASLIVLSAPRARHHGASALSPGHIAGKLLAHSPAPVAIIPEPEPLDAHPATAPAHEDETAETPEPV